MLSEEYTEIVGDIFIGGEWQTHDLQPKIVALEEQLKIEKQKHLDTSNWALEQQERGDTLETKLKDAEAENRVLQRIAEDKVVLNEHCAVIENELAASEKREVVVEAAKELRIQMLASRVEILKGEPTKSSKVVAGLIQHWVNHSPHWRMGNE